MDKTMVEGSEMAINESVGARIKELREERRMKQEVLAGAAGVGRTTLRAYETGGNISIKEFDRVRKALGVTYKEFFDSPLFEAAEESV